MIITLLSGGNFVKKASHLSRCVMGTLRNIKRNIKNVVSNFLTISHKAIRVDLKCDV